MDFFISLQQGKFLTSRPERDTRLWKTAWGLSQVEREREMIQLYSSIVVLLQAEF